MVVGYQILSYQTFLILDYFPFVGFDGGFGGGMGLTAGTKPSDSGFGLEFAVIVFSCYYNIFSPINIKNKESPEIKNSKLKTLIIMIHLDVLLLNNDVFVFDIIF